MITNLEDTYNKKLDDWEIIQFEEMYAVCVPLGKIDIPYDFPEDMECKLTWFYNDHSVVQTYQNPEFLTNSFDLNINVIDLYNSNGNVKIDVDVIYNFWYYDFFYNTIVNRPNPGELEIQFTLNNKCSDKFIFDSDYFNDQNFIQNIIVFDGEDCDVNLFTNNLYLEVELSTNFNYFEENTFNFSTRRDSSYNVDISQFESEVIKIPLRWDFENNNIFYEEFSFFLLNKTIYEYPTTFVPNLKLIYKDESNGKILNYNEEFEINISLNGYNDIILNGKLEKDKEYDNIYSLKIIDDLYYDYDSYSVKKGRSNYHENIENKIILPYDISGNYGEIEFSLETWTYSDIDFNITIPIGNKNKLRGGNNSKFKMQRNTIEESEIEYVYKMVIPPHFLEDNYDLNFEEIINLIEII